MKSIKFPNMFSRSSINLVEDKEATKQNLKYLLLSSKGELFGDPYFGTNIVKFYHDPNDLVLQDLLLDDIYTAIAMFMPQISITRNDIKLERSFSKLTVSIKCINQLDFTTNLYNIVLYETQS